MSIEFIERYADLKSVVSSRSQPRATALARLSHLFLGGKHLAVIGDINVCAHALKVLYLQHNRIRCIENLGDLHCLTHLHLQRNRIERIDGLEGLISLQKLYLGMNHIRRLENLEGLRSLRELHVERQRWVERPEDGHVEFEVDAASVEALACHLKVLNISALRLASLVPFLKLYRLERLSATDNLFACPRQLGQELAVFAFLRDADCSRSPAQSVLRYKEQVLESAHHLDRLDGCDVPPVTRRFVRDFALAKARRMVHQKTSRAAERQSLRLAGSSAMTNGRRTVGPVIGRGSTELLIADIPMGD